MFFRILKKNVYLNIYVFSTVKKNKFLSLAKNCMKQESSLPLYTWSGPAPAHTQLIAYFVNLSGEMKGFASHLCMCA